MVRIITDSSADFEPRELEALGVECVPMGIIFGDRAYRETEELSKERFYELLTSASELPHTAQATLYDFQQVFQRAKDAGDDAVVVLLSSGLSGTCQTAEVAKAMCGYAGCHVVDSLTATAGERLLVEYAVRLRDQGRSAVEIAGELERLRERVTIFASPLTLEYLRRGGRLTGIEAAVGTAVQLKPIITVTSQGTIRVIQKVLGRQRSARAVLGQIGQFRPDPGFPIYAMYTGDKATGEMFAEALRAAGYPVADENIVNVGAAIGTHFGPGGLGAAYVREE